MKVILWTEWSPQCCNVRYVAEVTNLVWSKWSCPVAFVLCVWLIKRWNDNVESTHSVPGSCHMEQSRKMLWDNILCVIFFIWFEIIVRLVAPTKWVLMAFCHTCLAWTLYRSQVSETCFTVQLPNHQPSSSSHMHQAFTSFHTNFCFYCPLFILIFILSSIIRSFDYVLTKTADLWPSTLKFMLKSHTVQNLLVDKAVTYSLILSYFLYTLVPLAKK